MEAKMKKAVVIFSGGQDSTTCLIKALSEFDEVHCITFDYNQRHKEEIAVSCNITKELGVIFHKIMNIELLNELTISSLTRDNIKVTNETGGNKFPTSFVPGRNILFLTLAGIYAYQINAETIITGVCETDFSGYPDCRNEFIKSMEKSLQLGMDKTIKIEAPLMYLTKAETWELAEKYNKLEFIKEKTLTCYNGIISDGCGDCPACILRKKGFDSFIKNKV